jgi:hypothetical protein
MSILYPIAATADEALRRPVGFAVRLRQAQSVAGSAVCFRVEGVGARFATREALAQTLDADAAHPWCSLQALAADGRAPAAPAAPWLKDGRRWPQAPAAAPPVWRLVVSYWRLEGEETTPETAARRLRTDPSAADLDRRALEALGRQPLQPLRPQQPLDIGLFEIRPPDAPHIVMPDE